MRALIAIFLLGLLIGCSDFDHEWRNEAFEGRKFKKLVVVGLSHELERRKTYEETGTAALAKYGIPSVRGLSVFPQEVTERENNHEELTQLIIQNEVDAVLLMKVLHEDDHAYIMPEDHKSFVMYYGRWGRAKSSSLSTNYYKRPEKYYMIATLYDLHEKHEENEETAVWRAISVIINPDTKIEKKNNFIRASVEHLVEQGLIVAE